MSYPPPGENPDPRQPYGPPDHPGRDDTEPDRYDPPEQYGQQPGQYGLPDPYGQQSAPPEQYGQYGPPPEQPGQYGQQYGQYGYYGQPGQYGQPGLYGQPPPGGYPPGYGRPAGTNVLAILSLVFAFVFAPAGIVLGHVARRQIRQSGEQGSGLATAGLVLSYLFTALYLIFCCGWLALGIWGGDDLDGGSF
ncbi:DUF4190 domain-containing protein [Micromonospora sp. NPDC050397]|uniref:DUF4190 domain-containing protein n=1 Tax=Micromonospora sp. NPDC050397 TaxID=3364279 RepID=UPI003850FFF9